MNQKLAKPSLQALREQITPAQRELLDEVWEYFLKNRTWLTFRELYSRHTKARLSKVLRGLDGNFFRRNTQKGPWPALELTLLGVLMTSRGEGFQKLFIRMFEYQRELFYKRPNATDFNSKEIQSDLNLNDDEAKLLGELIWIGGAGSGTSEQWRMNALEEAENFPKEGDLLEYLSAWLLRYYDKELPSNPDELTSWFAKKQMPSIPWQANQLNNPVLPTELDHSLSRLREQFPDDRKLGFLIMRFDSNGPLTEISKVIKETGRKYGLEVIRADDHQFHQDLLGNVRTMLHGCSFGIAVYERINHDRPNANVGLEVGYLMAMNKPVLLLKDSTMPLLQSDLAGRLYRSFDTHKPEKTIPREMKRWLNDHGIIVTQEKSSSGRKK